MAYLIPAELKHISTELGCNTINFVTTAKEGDIFSLASTDEKGNYLPIGLPIMYAVSGSIIQELSQKRIDQILSTLK